MNKEGSTKSSTTERSVKRLEATISDTVYAQIVLVCNQWENVKKALDASPLTSGAVDFERDRMSAYIAELRRRTY